MAGIAATVEATRIGISAAQIRIGTSKVKEIAIHLAGATSAEDRRESARKIGHAKDSAIDATLDRGFIAASIASAANLTSHRVLTVDLEVLGTRSHLEETIVPRRTLARLALETLDGTPPA